MLAAAATRLVNVATSFLSSGSLSIEATLPCVPLASGSRGSHCVGRAHFNASVRGSKPGLTQRSNALRLNVHPSRDANLLTPDRIRCDPPRDASLYWSFGNRVTQVEVPAGLVAFTNRFVIHDSGQPDEPPRYRAQVSPMVARRTRRSPAPRASRRQVRITVSASITSPSASPATARPRPSSPCCRMSIAPRSAARPPTASFATAGRPWSRPIS